MISYLRLEIAFLCVLVVFFFARLKRSTRRLFYPAIVYLKFEISSHFLNENILILRSLIIFSRNFFSQGKKNS